MKILLINPNISESVTALIEAEARRAASPGTEFTAVTASFGVAYIETRFEALVGGYAAACLAGEHWSGHDAVIVAAFGDPGMPALREAVPVPVVGLTESALATACLLGARFSIVAISRRIVGWSVHTEESSELAAALIARASLDAGSPKGLKLHSDNGGPMKGCTMLAMLQSLGMSASFSRPRVSDDNPYSEALFRTVKYSAMFPDRPFETIAAARIWVAGFVTWYNTKHRHSAIRFVTPDQRHFGHETGLLAKRAALYELARRQNPNRWSRQTRNWSPAPAVHLGPVRLRTAPTLKVAIN